MIKNKKNELFNILPFVIYSVLIIILHINMNIRGDDEAFLQVLQKATLIEWNIFRYNFWTSRIIIETIIVLLVSWGNVMWKILNIGMFTLLPYSINKLFNDNNDLKLKWLICIVTLLIPINCYGDAGWIATSVNYMWTLVFGILACIPIKKDLKNEKLTIWERILSIISIIMASNHEQMVAILLIFYGLTLIHNIKKKNKNNWIIIYMLIILLSIVFIFTCPGNNFRSIIETELRFPSYKNFNFINKIELGITSMMRFIVIDGRIVFFASTLIIMFAVFATNKSKLFRIVSIIQFTGSIPLNIIKNILPNNLIVIKDTIDKFNKQTLVSQLFTDNNMFVFYIMFAYYIIILISMIISLYAIFKNTNKSVFAITLFGAGVISRVLLGFSPTVYASVERISLFLYASCIILIIYVWKYLKDLQKDNKLINIIILLLCLIAYVQNIIILLSVY